MITKVNVDCGSTVNEDGRPIRLNVEVSFYNPSKKDMETIKQLTNSCLSEFTKVNKSQENENVGN